MSRIILLNKPEKHSNSRSFNFSEKLNAMLMRLKRSSKLVFGDAKKFTVIVNFAKQRKRIAKKLNNPRFLQIHFHTLRHWKATMEYKRTKDILYVMKLLGHKNINNTLLYTQLLNFEQYDVYHSATATTVDERFL